MRRGGWCPVGLRRARDRKLHRARPCHKRQAAVTFSAMLNILNLDHLEGAARERLDPMLYDYLAGGAGDEWTLHENRAAWNRVQLLPRMLRGVSDRQLTTTVLGSPVSFPVLVPPMAFQGMCHTEAEAATASATA